MSSAGSVTNLISLLKAGDAGAAEKLWELFSARLLNLARDKLHRHTFGVADEEDIVLSALGSFFSGAKRGEFTRLSDRQKLWRLLAVLTKRKAIDLLDRETSAKRRAGKVENGLAGVDEPRPDKSVLAIPGIIDPKLSPELQAMTNDACQKLLDDLGDVQLRSIAVWKLEGYSDGEIAGMLGCAVRTVERKLQLIRRVWCQASDA
jgi:DNA-directed RNA polymerase specialized sigma24 family protein